MIDIVSLTRTIDHESTATMHWRAQLSGTRLFDLVSCGDEVKARLVTQVEIQAYILHTFVGHHLPLRRAPWQDPI